MHTLPELHELLSETTAVKREKLAAVISSTAGASPAQICDRFLQLRADASDPIDAGKSYKQIVTDVADAIGLDWTAIDGNQKWEELKTGIIEEHIARRLYAGAKKLPDARTVPLRPIRVLVRVSLAELLSTVISTPSPTAGWVADGYAERLAGSSFNLSPAWNSLLAGVMFVHTEVR